MPNLGRNAPSRHDIIGESDNIEDAWPRRLKSVQGVTINRHYEEGYARRDNPVVWFLCYYWIATSLRSSQWRRESAAFAVILRHVVPSKNLMKYCENRWRPLDDVFNVEGWRFSRLPLEGGDVGETDKGGEFIWLLPPPLSAVLTFPPSRGKRGGVF